MQIWSLKSKIGRLFISTLLVGGAPIFAEEPKELLQACSEAAVANEKIKLPKKQASAWSKDRFSDPARHNSKAYRYLGFGSSSESDLKSAIASRSLGPHDYLSLFLIDQNHNNTWRGVSLILEVPEKAIFAAHSSDMESDSFPVSTVPGLVKFASDRFGLPSPEAILMGANHLPGDNPFNGHTEILALAKDDLGRAIRVTGVLVKRDSLGNPIAPKSLVESVTLAAEVVGLPVISVGPPDGVLTLVTEYNQLGINVHCSSKEFARLKARADQLKTRIIAVDNQGLASGVFDGESLVQTSDLAYELKANLASKPHQPIFYVH